jgi:prepilin signal peptidase PulO-like enzyme (type II secretory pathway)
MPWSATRCQSSRFSEESMTFTWTVIVAGIVGWVLGWGSALLTDWLQGDEQALIVGRSLLVRDPLVQAGSAAVWVAARLVYGDDSLRWVYVGLLAVPLIQVGMTDLRTRYVYTVIVGIGVALGLAFGWRFHGVEWWTSLAGALGAFVAFLALYLLGRLLYRGRGVEAMARGDIEIAAMVGAVAATCTAAALFEGVFIGGALALGTWIARRSRHGFMPYGPGLCLGGLVSLFWC